MDGLVVSPDLTIPATELEWRFARSGGPGGQHVNTSATKAELRWDVVGSPTLRPDQRQRLLTVLARRLDADGVLHVAAEETRSQLENRRRALARLRRLVALALVPPRPRQATRPTSASRERRLARKRHRGTIKGQRQQRFDLE